MPAKSKKQLLVSTCNAKPCRPPIDFVPAHSSFAGRAKAGKTAIWKLVTQHGGKHGNKPEWIEDDGTPGLAFIGARGKDILVVRAPCSCAIMNGCVQGDAATYAFEKLDFVQIQFDTVKAIAKKKPTKK